jgi:hypothetical protein
MPPSPPSIYFEIKCTFICARERGERREIESYFEFIIAQQPYWGAPNAMRACDTSLSLSTNGRCPRAPCPRAATCVR